MELQSSRLGSSLVHSLLQVLLVTLFAIGSVELQRIPEALSCLHDKVVVEAAEAALKFSLSQKNKQTAPTGILGGIIKDIKGEKENESANIEETRDILLPKLEALFSRFPFSVSNLDLGDDFDVPINLVVDKIEVEPTSPAPSSQTQSQTEKNKQTERERLLESGSPNAEPKASTRSRLGLGYMVCLLTTSPEQEVEL